MERVLTGPRYDFSSRSRWSASPRHPARPSLVSLVVLLALSAFASVSPPAAWAQLNVGNIVVQQYDTRTSDPLMTPLDPADDFGGVSFVAQYVLNNNFAMQTCATQNSLRWIQLVTTNKTVNSSPTPNRPFIDPRQGQSINGGMAMGDKLPFYDGTFNTLADFNTRTNKQVNGSGTVLADFPRALFSRFNDPPANTPFTFTAQTLLVSDQGMQGGNEILAILGGVQWGFSNSIVGGNNVVTKLALTQLTDTAAVRNAFNTALTADFPGYLLKDSTVVWNVPERPVIGLVVAPEPGGCVLLLFGLGMMAVVSHRRPSVERRANPFSSPTSQIW